MNLETAHHFVWDSLMNFDLHRTVMRLTDDDLQPSRGRMDWRMETTAGEYRDLELALDLTGNLDAPL